MSAIVLVGGGAWWGWEVANLAREIKLIQGVLEVGLFVGWDGVQAARKGRGNAIRRES